MIYKKLVQHTLATLKFYLLLLVKQNAQCKMPMVKGQGPVLSTTRTSHTSPSPPLSASLPGTGDGLRKPHLPAERVSDAADWAKGRDGGSTVDGGFTPSAPGCLELLTDHCQLVITCDHWCTLECPSRCGSWPKKRESGRIPGAQMSQGPCDTS